MLIKGYSVLAILAALLLAASLLAGVVGFVQEDILLILMAGVVGLVGLGTTLLAAQDDE